MKKFKTFGVMIDMSRNAVMSLPALKRYLELLKKMGYNMVMLYTEDTYEVNNEPYFGYMRGRYSKDEIREIDSYAKELGIELIPCIQTLAHLNSFRRWAKAPYDLHDMLLVGDDRTYELIDNMFATLSECYTTKRVHIGMDEAHMLGRGKYFDLHGQASVSEIMKIHFERICAIADKYGFELMIWSDMYIRPWNNGNYLISKAEVPQEYIDALPKSVTPVYWDYYQPKKQSYLDMIYNHKQLSDKLWFAGGAWSWCGFIPHNRFTLEAMIPAIDACREEGVENVFFTMWGDDGAECSHFSQLPSLFYLAEYAKGNTDEQKIKEKFKRFSGIDFDEFMYIDSPDDVVPYEDSPRNPSKYMLHSDYFNGFLDYTVKPGAGVRFEEFAEKLHATAKKSRKYGYVFDTAARLSDVLAVKYELGVKTRAAYRSGDRQALRALAENDYTKLVKLIEKFFVSFEKQWMTDNKPCGFDIQERRLGGLIARTKSCRKRLLEYVDGKIDKIEELECEILPYGKKEESILYIGVLANSSANVQ